MKKYLKLTTNDAIRHFILKDSTLAPETSDEVRTKLNELGKYKSDICVSLLLPTHRTRPDSRKDVIELKNLISQADKELRERVDKRTAASIVENLHEAQESVDFSLNLDGMVVYANEHFSSVVKVPVELESRVEIGPDFDLSPLYKTRQQNSRYYILIVSRHNVRLIEAFNDKIVHEIDNQDFPFANDWFTTDRKKLAQDVFTDNLNKEFYNTADKNFKKYYNNNPLPLVVMGDVKTTSWYEQQMDYKNIIMGYVQGNYEKMPLHEVIAHALPVVEEFRQSRLSDISALVENATSGDLITNDPQQMVREAFMGNASRLVIGNNFDMRGTIDSEGNFTESLRGKGESILPRLEALVCDNGGEIIYAEDEFLEGYGGALIIKRYDLQNESEKFQMETAPA